jgi:hypothetical protein
MCVASALCPFKEVSVQVHVILFMIAVGQELNIEVYLVVFSEWDA